MAQPKRLSATSEPAPVQGPPCRNLHMVTPSRAWCCNFGRLAAKAESHGRTAGGYIAATGSVLTSI